MFGYHQSPNFTPPPSVGGSRLHSSSLRLPRDRRSPSCRCWPEYGAHWCDTPVAASTIGRKSRARKDPLRECGRRIISRELADNVQCGKIFSIDCDPAKGQTYCDAVSDCLTVVSPLSVDASIHIAQVELSIGIALLRRLTIPRNGLCIILGNAFAVRLCPSLSRLCGGAALSQETHS